YLTCKVFKDSIIISNTNGIYYPMENIWTGNKGKVSWERAGMNPANVYAEFNRYQIDLTKTGYNCDSVWFTNKNYLNAPILGSFEDKVSFVKSPSETFYPSFSSYNKHFKINNIYPHINYEGGFSMEGAKLIGSGTDQEPAHMTFFQDTTKRLKAISKYFVIRNDRMIGPRTKIILKVEKDSISHPEMTLNYDVKNREVSVTHSENFISQSPASNTYHKIDMSFEQMSWKMDSTRVYFTRQKGTTISKAVFESVNAFDQQKFDKLQGMDILNPLIALRNFSYRYHSSEFPVKAFADYMRRSLEDIRRLVINLAVEGYLWFDEANDRISLRPRLFNYVNSSTGKIDYDVMRFVSTTNIPVDNSWLNLKNNDLVIQGIPLIFISDSQNVVITPKYQRVTMKKNRAFEFDGKVDAGNFTFNGKNFLFNYEGFDIDLRSIDSMRLRVLNGKDGYGKKVLTEVKNNIENINGVLLIDKPDNKSGTKMYKDYPIFQSREKSYVYYDNPQIQKGAYKRNDFFFELDPFRIDSMDNFHKEGIAFTGTFHSAGILPAIQNKLKFQKDSSLGFTALTGTEGINLYGGKGIFHHKIDLSNQGLKGNGELNYLTSTTSSENFTFLPDSTIAEASNFKMAQNTNGTEYPEVEGKNHRVCWYPKNDKLFAYQDKSPYSMFNNEALMKGTLELKPGGLTGRGTMSIANGVIESRLFTYKSMNSEADTSQFHLKSEKNENLLVLTQDVKSEVDFKLHKGTFLSKKDITRIEFPANKYISYIDKFIWNMNTKEIDLGSGDLSKYKKLPVGNDSITGPRYVSSHPAQDSLSFVSPLAVYDYQKNIIHATGVKLIRVADAIIYPSKGEVNIEENARMQTLKNAGVTANYTNRRYKLYDAELDIASRKKYTGKADYDYIEEDGKVETIHFSDISVDTTLQTTALATLAEPDSFMLSPYFAYQGKVILKAAAANLTFDGGARIFQNCPGIKDQWLAFNSEIDPKNIYIPISSSPLNINHNKIYAGPFIARDSIHIFSTFLSYRKNYNDQQMVSADGFLHYNKDSDKYEISSKEKILDFKKPDNYLSINRNGCLAYSEGDVSLGVNFGQMKLTSYGKIRRNLITDETTLNLMTGMDFYINDKAMNIMGKEIDSIPNLTAFNMSNNNYLKGINWWVGTKKADELKTELGLYGNYKSTPPELKHTLFFSSLQLKWNDETNSYVSTGKIGIASIAGIQINKEVNGLVEITRKRSGDLMDVYLEMAPGRWYYFGYTRGVMQVLSSNKDFVNAINSIKPNNRILKVPRNQEHYNYLVSSDEKFRMFLSRYKKLTPKVEAIDAGMPEKEVQKKTEVKSVIKTTEEKKEITPVKKEEENEEKPVEIQ
ncbi:MAG: hypothetical protein Q8907_01685, partial [Bacteroidota bacterium]|nr:hypothetical protein [Bacteroidota bacterium]